LALFILNSLSISAQCQDYHREMQNVESYISVVIRDLKKAEKADSLEKAQQLIDNAVVQAIMATKTATLAKEYAVSCRCNEGILHAANIYNAAFDYRVLAQKAADCGILEDMKKHITKSLIILWNSYKSFNNRTVVFKIVKSTAR
jgi:hypothetical protein